MWIRQWTECYFTCCDLRPSGSTLSKEEIIWNNRRLMKLVPRASRSTPKRRRACASWYPSVAGDTKDLHKLISDTFPKPVSRIWYISSSFTEAHERLVIRSYSCTASGEIWGFPALARHVQIARFHSAAARSADWTPNSIAFIIRRSSPNRKKDTAGRMTVGVRQTINACMHFQLVHACLHSTMQERA